MVEDEPGVRRLHLDRRELELRSGANEADTGAGYEVRRRLVGAVGEALTVIGVRAEVLSGVLAVALADLSLQKRQSPCLKLSERGHGSILRVSLAEDEKVRPDLVRDHRVPDRRGVAVQVADAGE